MLTLKHFMAEILQTSTIDKIIYVKFMAYNGKEARKIANEQIKQNQRLLSIHTKINF